eukprot:Gregarina_sp_Poly_1__3804@NODE_212_length_11327_cov_84_360924_g188_i0_p6_GENE_NODE_212_length_11327_cov_84_360924_g188_i0NODE_212_length_11327_cov_84_360924_g188_i0_p6_ORF_typecomplete_len252_score25_40RNase_PH/PF01138_21/1_9e14RNase_PH/PF01138_21/3_7e03_NODE_212_length_11327_cov_84_360924_g188_i030163771
MTFREDGRSSKELRPLSVCLGHIKGVQCSAVWECGLTKVVCSIRGPSSSFSSRRSFLNAGFIAVHFEAASNHSDYKQYESIIQSYLTNILDLRDFPLTILEVCLIPLCNDGSLLAASINAATAAVLHGGIPHKRLGVSVAIGVADQGLPTNDDAPHDSSILVDPLFSEESQPIYQQICLQYGATYILDADSRACLGIWPEVGNGATMEEMGRMEVWAKATGQRVNACLVDALREYKEGLKLVVRLNNTVDV